MSPPFPGRHGAATEAVGTVLAHGVGGRQDLPIPFWLAVTGAAVAVLISFAATGLWWRASRLRGDTAGHPLPDAVQQAADGAVLRWTLRLVGLGLAAFVAVAALLGPDDRLNPTAGMVYVMFWVGLIPASLLAGPVWRRLNPLRTVHHAIASLAGRPPEQGWRPYPRQLGYWPAALGLFAFTWLELVAPDRTSPRVLLAWFTLYAAVHLLGALTFGSRWFDHADSFEVYSALIGRLSPFGRRCDGRLVARNPFNGLDGLQAGPGLVAVACVMLGSTAYDGYSNAPAWLDITQRAPVPWGTLGLAGTILIAGTLYATAVGAAGLLGELRRRGLPAAFAHSLIPIAVGYLVAHYFSLLVFEGQHTVILASDPLGTGANLFGTAERGVDFGLVSAATIAVVQVLAVVGGHVLGVVAAHDRAVRLLPRRHAVTGQLPLLILMVAYTVGGLTLLFAA